MLRDVTYCHTDLNQSKENILFSLVELTKLNIMSSSTKCLFVFTNSPKRPNSKMRMNPVQGKYKQDTSVQFKPRSFQRQAVNFSVNRDRHKKTELISLPMSSDSFLRRCEKEPEIWNGNAIKFEKTRFSVRFCQFVMNRYFNTRYILKCKKCGALLRGCGTVAEQTGRLYLCSSFSFFCHYCFTYSSTKIREIGNIYKLVGWEARNDKNRNLFC